LESTNRCKIAISLVSFIATGIAGVPQNSLVSSGPAISTAVAVPV
jgi:hypothetical protein